MVRTRNSQYGPAKNRVRKVKRRFVPDPNDPFEAEEDAEQEIADWMIAPDCKG